MSYTTRKIQALYFQRIKTMVVFSYMNNETMQRCKCQSVFNLSLSYKIRVVIILITPDPRERPKTPVYDDHLGYAHIRSH